MTDSHLQVFRNAALFSGLPEQSLLDVADRFSRRKVQTDEFLFHEGDPASMYYLILDGQAKILQTSAEGMQVILHLLGPGEIAGALPTLGEGAYPGSAVALEPLYVGMIHCDDFDQLLLDFPRVCANMLRFATSKLQETHQRLREMATERVERRIARTLCRLAVQFGSKESEGVLLDANLSRQDLAEMTGTTVFTVSRTLKKWEREGIISAHRMKLTIHDANQLMAIGEDLIQV